MFNLAKQTKPESITAPTRRLFTLIPIIVFLVFAVIRTVVAFYQISSSEALVGAGADMAPLYVAGALIAEDLSEYVYLPREYWGLANQFPAWVDILTEIKAGRQMAFPYIYSPLLAEVMAGVTRTVTLQEFVHGMHVFQILLLAFAPWLSWKILVLQNPRFETVWYAISALVICTSLPFVIAIQLNQLQISISVLVVVMLFSYRAGYSVTAGVLLAIVAAIKISPAIFGLIFLLDRNWRAAIAMFVSGLMLLIISLSTAGLDLHISMLDRLQFLDSGHLLLPASLGVETKAFYLYDYVRSGNIDTHSHLHLNMTSESYWLQVGPKILGLASILWICLATWKVESKLALAPRALAISLVIGLFGPLGWAHYFCLPILLLPALFNILSARAAVTVLIGSGAILFPPVTDLFNAFNPVAAAIRPVLTLFFLGILTIVLWNLTRLKNRDLDG